VAHLVELQVTMIKCKFIGFKFAVHVQSGAQVTMQTCSMDLPSSPVVDDTASLVGCLLSAVDTLRLLIGCSITRNLFWITLSLPSKPHLAMLVLRPGFCEG
jgi:hypothetical protein